MDRTLALGDPTHTRRCRSRVTILDRRSLEALAMRPGLAICVVLLALAGPAAGQEIRPTLDKIKETSVVQLGYRETSRPFSFRGSDGQPAGFSIDSAWRWPARSGSR